MKVYLSQQKSPVFGKQYDLFKDGRNIYSIKKIWYSIIPTYAVFELRSGNKIGKITNKFLSLKANGLIKLGKREYSFVQQSFNSKTLIGKNLNGQNQNYEITARSGLEHSIYQDNIQIGYSKKNAVVIFEGDRYEFVLNHDADYLLLACMYVLLDTYRFSIKLGGSDIGLDIGNLSKGINKPNSNWIPKEKADS